MRQKRRDVQEILTRFGAMSSTKPDTLGEQGDWPTGQVMFVSVLPTIARTRHRANLRQPSVMRAHLSARIAELLHAFRRGSRN
ncbi:MAG TPA: hypothetical protein VEG30_11895 [Terriglobales bacterium]|nr:hypothetical protein [Terriglobales bacterium]